MSQSLAKHAMPRRASGKGAKAAKPARPAKPSPPPALTRSERAASASSGAVTAALAVLAPEELESEPTNSHLSVVEPTRKRRDRRRHLSPRVLFVSGFALVVVVLFGLVYLHVVMAEKQLQLDTLTTKAAQEQSAYQRLRLQVAQLGSPQAIIQTAEGKLGMEQPTSVTYLTAPAGTSTPSASSSSSSSTSAPAGDADWPKIKAELGGGQ